MSLSRIFCFSFSQTSCSAWPSDLSVEFIQKSNNKSYQFYLKSIQVFYNQFFSVLQWARMVLRQRQQTNLSHYSSEKNNSNKQTVKNSSITTIKMFLCGLFVYAHVFLVCVSCGGCFASVPAPRRREETHDCSPTPQAVRSHEGICHNPHTSTTQSSWCANSWNRSYLPKIEKRICRPESAEVSHFYPIVGQSVWR